MNILFLEDQKIINELGILKKINYFDGNKNYKINAIKLKKYHVVISLLYTNPLTNFLIIKAKRYGIQTILLSDGIIEWENCFTNPMNRKYSLTQFHPILHDIFLCVGKKETKYFNFLGYHTMQFLPDRMAVTIPRLGKNNNNTFLITTANTAYYTDNEKESLIQLIQNITHILDILTYKYIFRIFDDKLVKRLDIDSKFNITEGSYEECLKKVDCVITTPSSISFTTMYHGKALAHLIYRDSPMFIQAGWNISGSINIEDTIKSMLTFDQDRMNFQEFQVSNYLVDNEEVDKEVLEKLKTIKTQKIEQFINQNLYNMLNSSFNFNIEYFVRKIYLKFKNLKIMKILKRKLK